MEKLTNIRLVRVQYIPKTLEPGRLYVSEEFSAAVHLCACGCGTKISTPLEPTEWSLTETNHEATLRPSVGNWQHSCRSHYLIDNGNVIWCGKWTEQEVFAGRTWEEQRRREYYDALDRERVKWWVRFWRWLIILFR